MSLAMEETTFHVGKPLPSAQSMPEEKGRVNALRGEPQAQLDGVTFQTEPPLNVSRHGKFLLFFVFFGATFFSRKDGLIEEIIKLKQDSFFISY